MAANEETRQLHKTVADDAAVIKQSTEQQVDSADRRTVFAGDRTVLAAERTYAAWVRTGLAALASGVGARQLLDETVADWIIGATGSVLIAFSAFCFVAAVWRQIGTSHLSEPEVARMPEWLLIGVNGFLVLVSLAVLVGTWTG